MPAYFKLVIELDRKAFSVGDFYKCLADCGAVFKEGVDEGGDDTVMLPYDELVRMQEDDLRHPKRSKASLVQAYFDFNNFSEVRGYWMRFSGDRTAHFHLIIPEEDFIFSYEEEHFASSENRRTDAMEAVESLAVKLWENFPLLCVQTGWELSDYPEARDELYRKKARPQAEPFAIVDTELNTEGMPSAPIGRGGILVNMDDNWFYH